MFKDAIDDLAQLLAGELNSAEAPIVKTISTNISANITCIKMFILQSTLEIYIPY